MARMGGKKRMMRLPPNLQNPPQVHPWLTLFWSAWKDLRTERYWPEGPIPWSRCEEWAAKHGLDAVATELLEIHVQSLDLAYREWMAHNNGDKGGAT